MVEVRLGTLGAWGPAPRSGVRRGPWARRDPGESGPQADLRGRRQASFITGQSVQCLREEVGQCGSSPGHLACPVREE